MFSMNMNWSKLLKKVKDREAWHAVVPGLQTIWHDLVTEQHKWPMGASLVAQ